MANVIARGPRLAKRWEHPFPFRFLARVHPSAADLASRGVVPTDVNRAEALQAMAQKFMDGYNCMLLADPLARLEALLTEAVAEHKAFMMEGAAMGAAVRDSFSLRGGLFQTLSALHGASFEYVIAVGAGWAVARMPWQTRRILASLDPVLVPLAYDGCGFHDLFFEPSKAETGNIGRYSGARGRGYDAGLGRALWFIASGDVKQLDVLLEHFDAMRRHDLLAGVGLAMAFAGPTSAKDWHALRAKHNDHWMHVGQGVCFAAEAMRRAGVISEHTDLACREAIGLSLEQAAKVAACSRPTNVTRANGDDAYQAWRGDICRRLSRGQHDRST